MQFCHSLPSTIVSTNNCVLICQTELEQITCLPSEKDREVIYQAQCMEPAITEISLLSDTLTVSSQINNAQPENVAINDVLPLKAARRDAIAN